MLYVCELVQHRTQELLGLAFLHAASVDEAADLARALVPVGTPLEVTVARVEPSPIPIPAIGCLLGSDDLVRCFGAYVLERLNAEPRLPV